MPTGTTTTPTSLLDLAYNYGTTNNNGNVLDVTEKIGTWTRKQVYTYDDLNRLDKTEENNGGTATPLWTEDNAYDRWGNRWEVISGAPPLTFNSKNQIVGYSYDAAGNVTDDTVRTYGYDADNRLKAVDMLTNAFTYDGEGKRVKKDFPLEERVRFVYGIDGQLVMEFDIAGSTLKKEYVYGADGLLATIEPVIGTRYTTSDHLGSPRVVTDDTGNPVSRHDYKPFGTELKDGDGGRTVAQKFPVDDNNDLRHKFTGYERDDETGLDYAGARYYSSSHGRFTSADDFLNDTTAIDPASWNLYAYVRNNPLRYTDPTGEKVYVGNVTGAERTELLRRLNYTYGCQSCVSVDQDGFLAVDTTGLNQDVLRATQYLTDAITTNNPSRLFSVQITNNDADVAFGDSRAGSAGVRLPGRTTVMSAIRIRLDFGDDRYVIGDRDAREAFLNLVFAHEVAHFAPSYIQDPEESRQTGPVVDRVNEIQQARGLPLRAEYSANRVSANSQYVSVRFGRAATDRNHNVQRNRAGGIRVNPNTTLMWLRRNVGGRGIN